MFVHMHIHLLSLLAKVESSICSQEALSFPRWRRLGLCLQWMASHYDSMLFAAWPLMVGLLSASNLWARPCHMLGPPRSTWPTSARAYVSALAENVLGPSPIQFSQLWLRPTWDFTNKMLCTFPTHESCEGFPWGRPCKHRLARSIW